jgi:UDP-N-acetylmuramate: L-alanyl-gamma-D-glutamyl-meso-diaminopimelate ligase
VESLGLADRVVLAAVFRSESIPVHERLVPEEIVASLNSAGTPAMVAADADAIVAELAEKVRAGDVVAIMSNGGFDGIYEKLPRALEALASPV